jgi:hypothetical protein
MNRRELESEASINKTFLNFINFKMSFDVMFEFELKLQNSNHKMQKSLQITNKNSFS